MIALIQCPEPTGADSAWGEGVDTCLLPVVDRPILQHVLETLADCGVRSVHVCLPAASPQRQELLGDGARWGMTLRFWCGQPAEAGMWAAIRQDLQTAKGLITGCGDTLPKLADLLAQDPRASSLRAAGKHRGWTISRSQTAHAMLHLEADRDTGLPALYRETEWIETTSPLGLLNSQRLLLEGHFASVPLLGRELSPGVWVGRGARVHPTAVIQGPAYVGPYALVGAGCKVSAGSAIGEGAVLEEGSSMQLAHLGSNTRLGKGLTLHESLLIGPVLYSTKFSARVEIEDAVLASGI